MFAYTHIHSPDLELQPLNRCDIREVFGAPTVEEMSVIVNSHHPIIFRGGVKQLKVDRIPWSLDNFVAKYGLSSFVPIKHC